MAPEVVQGETYNATADWYLRLIPSDDRWSLGIILFECLYGYPPFWATTRQATQKIILDWKKSLEIPPEPRTSESARQLVKSLLTSAEDRLRTPTWEVDLAARRGHPVSAFQRMQVFKKDVRNHWFFRRVQMDFESVHLMQAPPLPRGKDAIPSKSRQSAIKLDHTEKAVKTKDILLHDERVLRERRTGAFKNYTYRGPDLGNVIQRLSKAIDTTEE